MASRLTRAAAAGLALLACTVTPGRADDTPAPVPLAGTTVIQGDSPARILVSLPKAVTFAYDAAKSATVSGPGRLVGVRLVEVHPQPVEATFFRMPPQLGGKVEVSAPAAGYKRQCDEPVPGYEQCWEQATPDARLRRGTYWLYLLTDGGPLTVTLRFNNLAGETTLTPTIPNGYTVKPFTASLSGTPDGGVWSGGAAATTTVRTVSLMALWWEQDESNLADVGMCWYEGSNGVEELGTYRWLPGCPFGSSVSFGEVRNPVSGSFWLAQAGKHGGTGQTWGLEPGTHSSGGWVKADGVRNVGGFSTWLEEVAAED